MAANSSRPNDQSLLDRLNALKPTSISLDKESLSNSSSPPPAKEGGRLPEKTVSADDVLAARLRALRNQSESESSHSAAGAAGALPPGPSSPPQQQKAYQIPAWAAPSGEGDQDTDHQALDDLLEGLDFDLDAADLDIDHPPPEFDPADEQKKVSALLEQLQKDSGSVVNEDAPREDHNADSDDSDGEQMTRRVENILSELRDEIALSGDPENITTNVNVAERPPNPTRPVDSTTTTTKGGSSSSSGGGGILSLPTVPSSPPIELPTTITAQDTDATNEDDEDPEQTRFENEITVRMASLKGLGSGINLDPFGLPSAPTFQPTDRLAARDGKKNKTRTSTGYTDEDQKTWCIVCLEDAVFRCLDCDDDVYCARCWTDMHIGPAAGYEERGHKRVRMER
ncbi:hypothetical protein B0T19DRAFT_51685 [Cercophora scortea]|uniref:Abscission/NoCut checkpoint regulator n=1 Tax=Cercophora scortea TaxID=314031 RepID=A0AAE0J4N7_9PEZI|nr:hypothetical protein B0T19DRAFT_51685 [Cercophora scortea]